MSACCARAAPSRIKAAPGRPCRRTAKKRDELAPLHSITSSASAKSVGGIARPSDLAVFAFTISSKCVGRSAGKSAGLVPLRTLAEGRLVLFRLRLLLLLGDLLGWLWRPIGQGRSVGVFLAVRDKGQPSAGHIEKIPLFRHYRPLRWWLPHPRIKFSLRHCASISLRVHDHHRQARFA
jgi:hypothetical protein